MRQSLLFIHIAALLACRAFATAPPQPNFLWIIAEDMGPLLGCYGEPLVSTPHLDAFAAQSVRFTQVWSGGAACSPSRSTLFSGLHAIALGTEAHRQPRPVPSWAFFPKHLREAGYFTTSRDKTDYNASDPPADWWSKSGDAAHYRNRPAGAPFFHCYASLLETHMSWIIDHPIPRRTGRTVDPAAVALPAWLPDEPEIRDDRAWHLDGVARMDSRVGRILAELEESGAADDTIVFFFSDHGGCWPGGKGFAWDYGFRVPLIVRFPPKFAHLAPRGSQPGGTCDALVSFSDFAPTIFALAGLSAPAYLQGRPFAGVAAGDNARRETMLAFRGSNAGRWDPVRAIRDARHLYIRNFLPHRIAGQRQNYQWLMPGQQAWERAFLAGRCNELQSRFWRPKPAEELYDLLEDPEQTRNLAVQPGHGATLARLRTELAAELRRIGDAALVPNSLRSPGSAGSFFERTAAEPGLREAVLAAAWEVSELTLPSPETVARLSLHEAPAVRYWAAVGLARIAHATAAVGFQPDSLQRLLNDASPEVRVAAAEAACASGALPAEGEAVLLEFISTRKGPVGEALAAVEALGPARLSGGFPRRLLEIHERAQPRDDFTLRSTLITLGVLGYDRLFAPAATAATASGATGPMGTKPGH